MQLTKELFKEFFLNYFWLGLVIILAAVIINEKCPESESISIITNVLESIGIAIMVASIFTFASGTSGFVEKMKSLLEDIIIKRDFLGNIDPEGKKEALKSLIQPSASEKSKYPNIGDYYGYFINKTLEIGFKSVRSNYQINARAFLDSSKNLIAVESTYSYRVYPSSEGFQPIILGFPEEESGTSDCQHVAISTPDGKRELHDNLEFEIHDQGGDISRRASIDTKKFNDQPHLDIEIKTIEYGADHWSLIDFQALQPTDGFKFKLHCDGDVSIQQNLIFVVGANYYVDESSNKKDLSITCNQWINEGSGLSVLVSVPCSNDKP